MTSFSKLRPLVMMQLKDKLDFSFLQTKRSAIIKTVTTILKFVIVTGVFYLGFFVCNLLSIFRPAGIIPDTVVNVIFVIIQLLSLITCTAGLVNALYMTADNKVLLTFPASSTTIYESKLIVYFLFELKKNLAITLPVFLAYGIINGAVWYYYPWVILCFVPVSLLPVAMGAVLSIPALVVMTFVRNHKWLQFLMILLVTAAISYALVKLIGKIPENINIMGQWGTIFLGIQNFLNGFSGAFKPYYFIMKMLVGGTLRISSTLFGLDTIYITLAFLGILASLTGLSFLVAKPLFIKMASRQFEFEKAIIPPKKNKTHKRTLSPYIESAMIELRSTRFIIVTLIGLLLPGIAIFLLNKIYAAMSTNYAGQLMTKSFNFLVMLIVSVSFNNEYATVYSKEGAARNLLKVRPIEPIHVLLGRISIRIVTVIASVIGLTAAFLSVSDASKAEIILMGVITTLVTLSHLLWSAELDVMHSYSDQYATVGMQFDSPNETKATILGFLLSILVTFVYYFISDRGTMHSLRILLILSLMFAGFRAYMFFIRSKLYFVEN